MEKIKITKEQAERIYYMYKTYGITQISSLKNGNGFHNSDNKCLNELTLEQICQVIYSGYEIILPPAPKLKTKKIDISFNSNITTLTKGEEIYIGLYNNCYLSGCKSFSIDETKEIANILNAFVDYYYQYVNQKD